MSTHRPYRRPLLVTLLAAVSTLAGCRMPGKPAPGPEVPRPDSIVAFHPLYQQNCAGCHGASGQNGSAIPLANPVYQAFASDDALRKAIAQGVPGTLMPGFSKASGGMLTDRQIDALIAGMRKQWPPAQLPHTPETPAYAAASAGDPTRGAKVYTDACARCHGAPGHPARAGNVLDGTFLSLLSPQSLRTIVIAGRPDLGHPDWRGDIPGRPLTDAEVTDLVAWMISLRPATPGNPYPNASSAPGSARR